MLSGPYNTFLARRFDREGNGRRLFASAMTMLGKRDREPSSYAEIAEAIDLNGAPGHIEEDLAQLFRRLVFNIVTGHRDDHLRNHEFCGPPPDGVSLPPMTSTRCLRCRNTKLLSGLPPGSRCRGCRP